MVSTKGDLLNGTRSTIDGVAFIMRTDARVNFFAGDEISFHVNQENGVTAGGQGFHCDILVSWT